MSNSGADGRHGARDSGKIRAARTGRSTEGPTAKKHARPFAGEADDRVPGIDKRLNGPNRPAE